MMQPAILLTRPEEDNAPLAQALMALGYRVWMQPVLRIEQNEQARNELAAQLALSPLAVILTSKNAVRALAKMHPYRHIPILAVGESTGREALKHYFSTVHVLPGTVAQLADYMDTRRMAKGRYLYAAAQDVTLDVPQLLAAYGCTVQKVIIYRAQPVMHWKEETLQALKQQDVKTVLFYSRRTASIFMKAAKQQDAVQHLRRITALCLSPAVANTLNPSDWLGIFHSQRPTQEGMLSLLASHSPVSKLP